MLVGTLAHDAALLRNEGSQIGGEVGGQRLLVVWCILQVLGCLQHIPDLLFGGQHKTLLLGGIHHQHLVLVGDKLLAGFVDFLQRHLLVKLTRQRQLVVDGDKGLASQEVLQTGRHIFRITTVVALTPFPFVVVQLQQLRTLQFRGHEAMLARLFHHTHGHHQS